MDSHTHGSWHWAAINAARGYRVRRSCWHSALHTTDISDLLENCSSPEEISANDWDIAAKAVVNVDSVSGCLAGGAWHEVELDGSCLMCYQQVLEPAYQAHRSECAIHKPTNESKGR